MSDVLEWIDSSGTAHTLSGQADMAVLPDRQGLFMPPIDFIEDEVPLQPGARLRQVKVLPREIDLAVAVYGTETSVRSRLREVLGWFDPRRGDGKLRVTSPDASVREIICRYKAGLALEQNDSSADPGFQKAVITLRAVDPYWQDTADTTTTYTVGVVPTFFPLFPMRLTSSTVFSDASINNLGDVEAWPVWTITGPGSGLVLRNITTGEALDLSTVLSNGDVVVVDTRRGKKTVKRNADNLYGDLSATSVLWPLQRGTNKVRIELSGATADSSVRLDYRLRYLGA